eukprot:1919599-Amphidinium_carterae.2
MVGATCSLEELLVSGRQKSSGCQQPQLQALQGEDNEDEKPDKGCVRTCKVSEPTMQRMAVMPYSRVKEGVAFTLPYLAALLTKVAREEEGKEDIIISRLWASRFVHKLGLSKKKVDKTIGVIHDKKEQAFNRRRLLYKVVWTQNEHSMPTKNLFNMDET